MTVKLPVNTIAGVSSTAEVTNGAPLIIVGANGAGKTRFAKALCDIAGDCACPLSVLAALYTYNRPDPDNILDRIFLKSAAATSVTAPTTTLERLIAMLMADELTNLLNFKLVNGRTKAAELPVTRLDRVVGLYSRTFPDNKVLLSEGRMLFGRHDSDEPYTPNRLSDGERAVLFYAAAILYAPKNALIVVETPEMFMHPATMQLLWSRLEGLRPDCAFVFVTHDLEFAASRPDADILWVQGCDTVRQTWTYTILPKRQQLPNEVYMAIMGARKPVLFIEGDERSIDWQLYPLIFTDYTVKPLGSCNKVIEACRTFNDLSAMHHLRAAGIVDRDRRDEGEVAYLRRKNIMVPDYAEIENILLAPAVVRAVAEHCRQDPGKVFAAVSRSVLAMFRRDLKQQALMHTRHRVKRTVEYRVDGRFNDISALEQHISLLVDEINPRKLYEAFCRDFHAIAAASDYDAVMRVYNQKSMLSGSNIAALCGLKNKEEYISTVLAILRDSPESAKAQSIRRAVRNILDANSR